MLVSFIGIEERKEFGDRVSFSLKLDSNIAWPAVRTPKGLPHGVIGLTARIEHVLKLVTVCSGPISAALRIGPLDKTKVRAGKLASGSVRIVPLDFDGPSLGTNPVASTSGRSAIGPLTGTG